MKPVKYKGNESWMNVPLYDKPQKGLKKKGPPVRAPRLATRAQIRKMDTKTLMAYNRRLQNWMSRNHNKAYETPLWYRVWRNQDFASEILSH